MTAVLFTLIVLGSVIYGLERNHRRHTSPRPRLAGTSHLCDRDLDRIHLELAAMDGRERSAPPRRHSRASVVSPIAETALVSSVRSPRKITRNASVRAGATRTR